MAEGLRPHHHVYMNIREHQSYDRKRHCIRKTKHEMCIICSKERWSHDNIPVRRDRKKR